MKSCYIAVTLFALFTLSTEALNCACDDDQGTARCCTVPDAYHDASNECIWDDRESDLDLYDFMDCCGGRDFFGCKDLNLDEYD